jgi:hypothetical protein
VLTGTRDRLERGSVVTSTEPGGEESRRSRGASPGLRCRAPGTSAIGARGRGRSCRGWGGRSCAGKGELRRRRGGQRRRLLKSERRTGSAEARVRWGFCCGLGWPEGRLRIRGEGEAGSLGVRADRATDPELPAVSLRPDLIRARAGF